MAELNISVSILLDKFRFHYFSFETNVSQLFCVDFSFCCIIKQLVDSLEQKIGW